MKLNVLKNVLKAIEVLVVFVGVLLAFSPNAHAYVDAGSGSYFLQILMASLFGALFSVKLYWSRIKLFAASLVVGKGAAGQTPGDAR